MQASSKPVGCRRGFSLTEMVIVVTIVGLVAGFAAPYTNTAQLQSDAATRKLVMLLLSAERLAVARQHDVIVGFDVAGHTVRTVEDRDNNGRVDVGDRVLWQPLGDNAFFAAPPAGVAGTVVAPVAGASLVTIDGMPSVVFRRSGATSTDAEVYLAAGGGTRRVYRAITVAQATGRPTWFRWLGNRWNEGSL